MLERQCLCFFVIFTNTFGLQLNDVATFNNIHGNVQVNIATSENNVIIQGGNVIKFNISITHNGYSHTEQRYQDYCDYVTRMENTVLFKGGDIITNCENLTRIVYSNFTCNTTDGINCLPSNITNANATEITKVVENNITYSHCWNHTTPLIPYKPTIEPPSYFNLTYTEAKIFVYLPTEFNIDFVHDFMFSNPVQNLTTDCMKYGLNTSVYRTGSQIKLLLKFGNLSDWSGYFIINAIVTERVVPLQLLNITGVVEYGGLSKSLFIGTYTVPEPVFDTIQMTGTTFLETPSSLLTDGEEVTIEAQFMLPLLTTDIKIFVKFPIFAGTFPLTIKSARVSSMPPNIKSEYLHGGSAIGTHISKSEVVTLSPTSETLVEFNFGTMYNSAGVTNNHVTLQVVGLVDTTDRESAYAPDSFGNVTSWITYSTFMGAKTVVCPVWVQLELGQPQIPHELSFQKPSGYVEGNDDIKCTFQFYNPAFATEASSVVLDITFANIYMQIQEQQFSMCDVVIGTTELTDCIAVLNVTQRPLITVSNTNTSLSITVTNLASGAGIFGNVMATVLTTVPAREPLHNMANIEYQRQKWSSVQRNSGLNTRVLSVTITSGVTHTSVSTTPETLAAIGEQISLEITVTIPISSNAEFAIVIGGEGVVYEQGNITHVGENLKGNGLVITKEFNETSSYIPEAGKTYSYPVLLGQFGMVKNTREVDVYESSVIRLQMSFSVPNIPANNQNVNRKIRTTVYHEPNRYYNNDKTFKVVEPEVSISISATPDINVEQDSEINFVAVVKHTSNSEAAAFNFLLQISIASPYLTLIDFTSNVGEITQITAEQAQKPFLSDVNSSAVILVTLDTFPHTDLLEIKYKVRTSTMLPPCMFMYTSTIFHYSSLPKKIDQSLAREYSSESHDVEGKFLTFRPEPYVTFSFSQNHADQLMDAGDVLNYTLYLKNTGIRNVQPIAYTTSIEIYLSTIGYKDVTINCSLATTSNNNGLVTITVPQFNYDQEIKCELTAVLNLVVPSALMEVIAKLSYHCLPPNLQSYYAVYEEVRQNGVKIKPLKLEMFANGDTDSIKTGDTLEYRIRMTLPEVTTSLTLTYVIPSISSDVRGKRSLRNKRAVQLNVLQAQGYSFTAGTSLTVAPLSTNQDANNFTITIPSIINTPDNVQTSEDILIIEVQFLVNNQPLVFSGRMFDLNCIVSYPGGSAAVMATFKVVGPLVKPLLLTRKSFHVLNYHEDSPLGIFYVNVTHNSSSLYDAHDVYIVDSVQGMNIVRSNEYPGTIITSRDSNTLDVALVIPVITVGQTIRFHYKVQFKVETKVPKFSQTPASITWKSVQLNSPVYGPVSDMDACVARYDYIKEKDEPLYSYLVVGSLIGFISGFIILIIVVCLFIKCCRKGRLVPYYKKFTGQGTYTILQENEENSNNNIIDIEQTSSIVYIISDKNQRQTEDNLEKLDIKETIALDRNLDTKRQTMFSTIFQRFLDKLRSQNDISNEKVKEYSTRLANLHSQIRLKNQREYEKRTGELKLKMQSREEQEIDEMNERMLQEIEEAKRKLENADKAQTKEILSMITNHYKNLEIEGKRRTQLDYDVEHEKIKKEISVNTRLSCKEAQAALVKEIGIDCGLNEETVQCLLGEHLDALIAIEKIYDDERSRQIMALEMRLEERRVLAQELRQQQEQEAEVVECCKKEYADVIENLVNTSKVSPADAKAFCNKIQKDIDKLDEKMKKQRMKQEQDLHDRMTLRKQKKMQEMQGAQQAEIKNIEEKHHNETNELMFAYQELFEDHWEEWNGMERKMDAEAAEELKKLREQLAVETRKTYKMKVEKYYKELTKKGILQANVNELLNNHDQNVARLLDIQESQRSKQNQNLKEKLSKRREQLTEKMKAEQKQHEKARKEEQKIFENIISNQVVISEEEKERIMREHERNMAELETSLTLNKLRQKQMLEEKLAKRRAAKMEQLKQKHDNENKRIKIENVDGTTTEEELLRKQEREKMDLMGSNSSLNTEIEQIREDMLKERMELLQEHNDRLAALITELQIHKANQIAEINKQQQALGHLQKSILDELDEKGVLIDPETKIILQQHQEQSQQLEKALQSQREQQEQAVKERLKVKLKQREETLILEQKNEISKYLDTMGGNTAMTRFRKAALKARHKSQLEHTKQQIEKEIEQSLNQMKLQLEVDRLQAVENQSVQFISALVKCGKIQEQELDSVLQVLFPTKKPEEIDKLLSRIYGPAHARSSCVSLNNSKPSSLELKVIAQINPSPSNIRKPKPRFETPDNLDELPTPEAATSLAPVILPGSKGFNLETSLKGTSPRNTPSPRPTPTPLGRVKLAPLQK